MFCGSQDLEDVCLCLLESESGGQEDLETVLEDQSGNYTLLFRGEVLGEKAQGKSVRKKVVFWRKINNTEFVDQETEKVGVSVRICKDCSMEV